ncbi:hypothetical protein [Streptomyces albicerus]|uniref:hypothetical protein n=1 Tax=Streptomyces albicerus TaxID=2569859 RepID=UPI00124B5E2E|nr:hypothetical protein [Streptomyces albicerus]
MLTDILVECGHCNGPIPPLPPEAPEPRYECLQQAGDACAAVTMPALEPQKYVAEHMLAELAKPTVADLLTEVLRDWAEEDLPQQRQHSSAKLPLTSASSESRPCDVFTHTIPGRSSL